MTYPMSPEVERELQGTPELEELVEAEKQRKLKR